MVVSVDFEAGTVTVDNGAGGTVEHSLGSAEGFNLVSQAWLRAGWDTKYIYSFTWMGRPLIQLPEDVLRLQEVIYAVEPDVVVETGVAHGGSLVLYASLLHAMGRGRVVGVDIEIRTHNREAIERHRLASLITLIEGDSTEPATVTQVRELIEPSERVLVVLDSNQHEGARARRARALRAARPSRLVRRRDGRDHGNARGRPPQLRRLVVEQPKGGSRGLCRSAPEFEIVEPEFAFNEGSVAQRVTYWPSAFLRRV